MEKEKVLQELGLSKNETKVYLALLEMGESTAGEVSKEAGVHRANVYDSLKRLKEKGFVGSIKKQGTKYFSASDPESLRRFVKQKEKKLDQIMPELNLSKSMSSEREASVHTGIRSARKLLLNLLKYEEPILVYGVPEQAPDMLKNWTDKFHKERISKEIRMDHIYNFEAKDRMKYLNSMDYTQAKHLSQEYSSPVATNICGPEVVLILYKEPVFSVRIVSKEIAEAYRKYFKLLWDMGEDIED